METSISEQAIQLTPVFLNWEDTDKTVVITPADNDRFVLTVQEAIEACRAQSNQGKFRQQFDILMNTLAEWLKENDAKISRSYMTIRDAGLLFLVVRKNIVFDSDFEDILTDLDIKIARDVQLDLVNLSVLAIPYANSDAISSFLRSGFTISFQKKDAQ